MRGTDDSTILSYLPAVLGGVATLITVWAALSAVSPDTTETRRRLATPAVSATEQEPPSSEEPEATDPAAPPIGPATPQPRIRPGTWIPDRSRADASSRALLKVESDPPGAQVLVGAQVVDGVVDFESGRLGCRTPCTVRLRASDVNSMGGITVELRKRGFVPHVAGLSDGRRKLAAGGTFRVDSGAIRLRRIGR